MALINVIGKTLYGTASEFASADPVLEAGQFGCETDTGVFKTGDGTTPYNSLTYPNFIRVTGGTMTGNLNGVTPTELGYLSGVTSSIQSQINNINSGLAWKASVRVATTANITLSGTQTIDGVSVIVGDRVLVKDQSTGSQNGIYVCASGAWSRASDATTGGSGSTGILQATVNIEEGTTNGDQMWTCSTNAPITIGSTSLTFIKTSNTTYTAGSGLSLSSNQFSISAGGVTNTMLAGSIAASKLIATDITTVGTISTGVWNATKVSELFGGTNQDSYTTGNILYASATNTLSKLAIGSAGQALIVSGGVPAWGNVTSLLGSAYYEPGSVATYTTTSTTFAAIDTTNLRVTFTAPASGNVIIKFGAWINGTQPDLGVLEGSTVRALSLCGTLASQQAGTKKITGLTPGVSYTYDLAFASTTGGVTTTVKAGGALTSAAGYGPAFIEIWAI